MRVTISQMRKLRHWGGFCYCYNGQNDALPHSLADGDNLVFLVYSLVSQSGLVHRQEVVSQRAPPAVVSAGRASCVDVGAWGSEMLALWPWQFSALWAWCAHHSLSGSDWGVPTSP